MIGIGIGAALALFGLLSAGDELRRPDGATVEWVAGGSALFGLGLGLIALGAGW